MNNLLKSFFKNHGNIESWNSDRLFVSDEIRNSQGVSSLSFFRSFLNNMDNDSIDEIKDEISYLSKKEFYYEDSLPEHLLLETSFRTYSIPKDRVEKGFVEGFIDAISHSYAKTRKGWVDESLKIIAPLSANIDELINKFDKNIKIIDSFSVKKINEVSKLSELIVNGKTLAVKNEDGLWVNFHGKKFQEGEVVRVIAHSDEPAYTYLGHDDKSYYHGNLSDNIEPDIEHKIRGMSSQGRAAYATSSIKESIAYANPYGFETSGKLLSLQEKGEIKDRKNFIFGHIYEIWPGDSSMFVADSKSSTPSFLDKPSISSLLLMCRLTGGNEIYVSRQWVDMINTETKYDTYAIMNNLNQYFLQHDREFNSLRKMVVGMGFDGISISFPSSEEFNEIESKIERFKEKYPKDSSKDRKDLERATKGIDKSLRTIKDSIPARGQDSHMILFNTGEMLRSHLKLLPFNEGEFMNQGELYRPETEISIEKLMKLKSPSFEDAKNFFLARNKKEDGLSIQF